MDPLTDRIPPQNRDAERGVLGGILRDPEVLADVCAVLRPDAMYFDAHRRIFAALIDLANRHEPIDLVSLHTELRRRKQLDDVGGAVYQIGRAHV